MKTRYPPLMALLPMILGLPEMSIPIPQPRESGRDPTDFELEEDFDAQVKRHRRERVSARPGEVNYLGKRARKEYARVMRETGDRHAALEAAKKIEAEA